MKSFLKDQSELDILKKIYFRDKQWRQFMIKLPDFVFCWLPLLLIFISTSFYLEICHILFVTVVKNNQNDFDFYCMVNGQLVWFYTFSKSHTLILHRSNVSCPVQTVELISLCSIGLFIIYIWVLPRWFYSCIGVEASGGYDRVEGFDVSQSAINPSHRYPRYVRWARSRVKLRCTLSASFMYIKCLTSCYNSELFWRIKKWCDVNNTINNTIYSHDNC